jgi:hypothetical protein
MTEPIIRVDNVYKSYLADPQAVVVCERLADYVAVGLGETIDLGGKGFDHYQEARVIWIARRNVRKRAVKISRRS